MVLAISRREWVFAFLIAILTTIILTIPYLLGYGLAKPGTVFTGIVMNPEDSQTYFAKILQGFDGRWLYSIRFTPEKHEPAFLGAFYLALGHLARWLDISIGAIWHLARIVTDMILFLITFVFVATFLRSSSARFAAYLLAIFGSGLGWLLFVLNQAYWLGAFPVDFKMPEAHLFFTALTFPHTALGTGLLLVSIWLLARLASSEHRSWLWALLAGFVNLMLAIVYPFLIYLVIVTSGLFWLYLCGRAKRILWRLTGLLALTLLIPAPLYAYYAYTLEVNEVFRFWDMQAITSSPPFPHYLVAYGFLFVLALLPALQRRKRPPDGYPVVILWLWLVAAAILVYAPLNPQRRFVQGIQVPLAIMATISLFQVVFPWLRKTRLFQWLAAQPRYSVGGLERLLLIALVAFASLSNIYLLADVSLTAAVRQPFPLFREEAELKAVEWVRNNADQSDVVLGSHQTGNYVAAHAGNPVIIGHWAETADWDDKLRQTSRFYDLETDDSWRRDFLRQNRVQYVWFGPRERELGRFSPEETDYLQSVFEESGVELFMVK